MILNLISSALLIIAIIFFPQNKNISAANSGSEPIFTLGNESLLNNNSGLIKDKRIGLITNTSGVLSNGDLLDSLSKYFTVTKIFTPEHGLRVDDRNENYVDGPTGIPIVSLYGSKKKPDAADLDDVDVFVYDLQDVSARFYTFINTMFYCMESAVENDKEFIICDRPIIPDGNYVDGFMLDEGQESFVGLIDVPAAYAMTCGELAGYVNDEYFEGKCRLNVVKMDNYSRDTDYSSLNLPWIRPSPSMYFPSTAVCYLGTCLFEGTNFAEGRGTDKPFEYIGAPYCDGKVLAEELNSYNFKGVNFESISFTPQTIASNSNPPKFIGEMCEGVYMNVTNKKTFEPVKAVIAVLVSLKNCFRNFS
ncbi:MAG: DUF1343 domain-containing protein [Ignavibacteria bacterium]|nr:DUF1343 domain-containing protein [Ignavibacteria bacterium]